MYGTGTYNERGNMFDLIDDGEFTPLDEERAQFLVGLAIDLKNIGPECPEEHRNMIEIAANNIMRLTSMTMAGYHLFASYKEHADDLFRDLGRALDLLDQTMTKESLVLRAQAYFEYENYDSRLIDEDEPNF